MHYFQTLTILAILALSLTGCGSSPAATAPPIEATPAALMPLTVLPEPTVTDSPTPTTTLQPEPSPTNSPAPITTPQPEPIPTEPHVVPPDTPTPNPPTPTPLISSNPSRLNLTASKCFHYKDTLADAAALNIPITPLPGQSPLETVNPTFTPPPSVDYVQRLGIASQLDAYAFEAADYLKDHQQEGIEGLRAWIDEHNLRCLSSDRCPNDLIAGDFDNDGTIEYIVTLSLRGKPFSDEPNICGSYDHPVQRVYLFSCQSNPDLCHIYSIGRLWEDADNGACINPVTDLNNDGQPELLITYHLCGASDCWDQLEVVSLSEGYRYLAPKIEVHNGCIAANDENGDGVVEIYASTTDFPGSQGATSDGPDKPPTMGPFHGYVSVYEWNEAEYTFSGRAYDHDCLFHVLWDGIDWAKRGELQTALIVFEIALANDDIPLECRSAKVDFPWRTYAQFAVGMLNAQLGHKDEAQSALAKVKALDAENIYTPLVDVFLESYSVDFQTACESLTQYVGNLEDKPFRGPYRHRQLITFCPSDMIN